MRRMQPAIEKATERFSANAAEPAAVAASVYRLVRMKRKPFRYHPTRDGRVIGTLKRLLPDRLFRSELHREPPTGVEAANVQVVSGLFAKEGGRVATEPARCRVVSRLRQGAPSCAPPGCTGHSMPARSGPGG